MAFVILSLSSISASIGPTCPRKHVRKVACQLFLTGFCPMGPECPRGQYVCFVQSCSIIQFTGLPVLNLIFRIQVPTRHLSYLLLANWVLLLQASLGMPIWTEPLLVWVAALLVQRKCLHDEIQTKSLVLRCVSSSSLRKNFPHCLFFTPQVW